MANRVAIIESGAVVNVIIADASWQAADGCEVVLLDDGSPVGPGWLYDGKVFAEPAPLPGNPVMAPIDFMRRFTGPERIAVRTASKQDPILEDAFALLNVAQTVSLDSPDTRNAVKYMAHLGLISAQRAAEILTP